jgi:hypothetical protein
VQVREHRNEQTIQSQPTPHAAALRALDQRYDRYDPDYRTRIQQAPSSSIELGDLQPVPALTALNELAATEAGRRPYTLPKKVCGLARNCLVQARLTSESDAAIAIDQIEVTAGQALPATLMLPIGEFNIDMLDAGGTQIRRLQAKVRGTRK